MLSLLSLLSLLACSADLIAPAFASERRIGNIRMSGTDLPNDDDRECYLQMESLMIIHHASEALLRLFFAHIDHPECPWIGMSASSNFNVLYLTATKMRKMVRHFDENSTNLQVSASSSTRRMRTYTGGLRGRGRIEAGVTAPGGPKRTREAHERCRGPKGCTSLP